MSSIASDYGPAKAASLIRQLRRPGGRPGKKIAPFKLSMHTSVHGCFERRRGTAQNSYYIVALAADAVLNRASVNGHANN